VTTASVSDSEARPSLRSFQLERIAAIVTVIALAVWIGGIIALGACAAPIVFGMVPAPWSGDAMGAVFLRFDALAIASSIVVLACEGLRIWLRPGRATPRERARGPIAIVAALSAIYVGVWLSPAIVSLHAAGAVRGLGTGGKELERLHQLAETLGKIEVVSGLLLIVLAIVTLEERREEAGST
jgi:Domain of unknown function (DUF4149)